VFLLTDGYLANGAEPWLLPKREELPDLTVTFADGPNHVDDAGAEQFWPFLRDPDTLARPWAVPGTPGLMHRIGGIEKADGSGNISYDPLNHQRMTELRAAKVAGIAHDIPPLSVDDPGIDDGRPGDLLVLGWGSTWGPIRAAVRRARVAGRRVAQAHFMHLNPLPANTADVLRRYPRVLVPEMNMGQLVTMLRANYLVDAKGLNKVQGRPFTAAEIAEAIERMLGDVA
jgi:2-oxoglutarate ferredoxin oxidoreductase subunit alpha